MDLNIKKNYENIVKQIIPFMYAFVVILSVSPKLGYQLFAYVLYCCCRKTKVRD